jgi:hypothetical protein
MNWCVRHGMVEQSAVPHLAQKTAERNLLLSDVELKQDFWKADGTPFTLKKCRRDGVLRQVHQRRN